MKTAVSLPDDLFARADQLAARRGISRSRLYAEALARLLEVEAQADATADIDDALRVASYARADLASAQGLERLARLTDGDDW